MRTFAYILFSTDVKMAVIFVLSAFILGMLVMNRNHGDRPYIGYRSNSGLVIIFLLLALIAGVIFYSFYSDLSYTPKVEEQSKLLTNDNSNIIDTFETDNISTFSEYQSFDKEKDIEPPDTASMDSYSEKDQSYDGFAIQISACDYSESAQKVVEDMYEHSPIIIEEDEMYKVLITIFLTEAEAQDYLSYYSIKGFIRKYTFDDRLAGVN